jgi:uncharacterized protein (TIGR03437 family)
MLKTQIVLGVFCSLLLVAPLAAQRNRIAGRINNGQRVVLHGHLHPKALPETDQGAVDPSLPLPRVTLTLQPSASQQAALKQLLAQQQDPTSGNYHHWLTPEQYADQFGVSQTDLNQIVSWLQSRNLTVVGVARARTWIAVSGTAAAVGTAFGTEIHHFRMNGELHYANATEPSIPAALQGIVVSLRGMNDFRLKPASHRRIVTPQYNNTNPCFVHCLGPDDVAAIYNVSPLFTSGLNGAGQKMVVVGQTNVRLSDIEAFRSFFNLPANDPQLVLVDGEADPGIVCPSADTCDQSEANLDLEIAGAVARNATILFVYSSDVGTSLQYAIDHNLAPVISMSYGDCEAAYAASDATAMEAMAQQANAQGITWFAASGDSGGADCYGDGVPDISNTQSVDMPASLPEVTGIGGTEFNDGTGNYWSASNTANNASALSYIPEIGWNDSAADGSPAASGGGASIYFGKPSWQSGTGVPADNARDVPDISISVSADHDGYLIYTSDQFSCGTRRGSSTACGTVVGGTSVGAPFFAGLFTLLNQAVVTRGLQANPGLGNINPSLYTLAQNAPAAFHDITSGNNIVTVSCTSRNRTCSSSSVGFNAGAGYDQVTGLGSIDASALFNAWLTGAGQHASSAKPPVISAISNGASYAQAYAPGMIVTIFGSQLAPAAQSASSTPFPTQMAGVIVTIAGIPAPLLYVSPSQLNVQIPYETPVGTSVVLTVSNNGQSASASFSAAAAAPGIFVNANGAPVPSTTGSRSQGKTLTLYVTGFGAVTPAMADGAVPASGTTTLPKPAATTTVTVGGITAPSVVGVPPGYAGVAQINYQIPSTVPLGQQAVVVTVGGAASNPAMLTVTQ